DFPPSQMVCCMSGCYDEIEAYQVHHPDRLRSTRPSPFHDSRAAVESIGLAKRLHNSLRRRELILSYGRPGSGKELENRDTRAYMRYAENRQSEDCPDDRT
ncbi:MAG: hypothetical protein ACKV22_03145, partial [Bryobacteraceae bacterium]